MTLNKQAQVIISDIRLKHGSGDAYAPIIRWDEFETIAGALEAAEKRIAELLKSAEISLEYVSGLENQIESEELRIAELERKEHHRDRQSVIDALATSGEAWSDIEEYMQKWDEARAAGIKIKGE